MANETLGLVFDIGVEDDQATADLQAFAGTAEAAAQRTGAAGKQAEDQWAALERQLRTGAATAQGGAASQARLGAATQVSGSAAGRAGAAQNAQAAAQRAVAIQATTAAASVSGLTTATLAQATSAAAALTPLGGLAAGFSRTAAAATAAGPALAALIPVVGGLVAAFAALKIAQEIVQFYIDSIPAALAQAQAETKLGAALQQRRIYTDELAASLIAQATAQQRLTLFEDDAIIKAQAVLATYGVQREQLKLATQATVDLASAMDISLSEAATHLGRTLDGTTGRLAEFVPALRGLTPEALKAGAALDVVAKTFAGRAVADAIGYAGATNRVSDAMSELREAAGAVIVQSPSVEAGLRGVAEVLDILTDSITTNRDVLKPFVLLMTDAAIAGLELAAMLQVLGEKALAGANALVNIPGPVQMLINPLAGLAKTLQEVGPSLDVNLGSALDRQAGPLDDAIERLRRLRAEIEKTSGALTSSAATAAAAGAGASAAPDDVVGPIIIPTFDLSKAQDGSQELAELMEGIHARTLQSLAPAVQEVERFGGAFATIDTSTAVAALETFHTAADTTTTLVSSLNELFETGALTAESFAKTMQAVFAVVGNAVAQGLTQALTGQQSFSKGMKRFLGDTVIAVGQAAIAHGAVKVASGLYPPQPPLIKSGLAMIGAGAAAIAAGAAMGGGGGGASAGAGASAGGGAGGGGGSEVGAGQTIEDQRRQLVQDISAAIAAQNQRQESPSPQFAASQRARSEFDPYRETGSGTSMSPPVTHSYTINAIDSDSLDQWLRRSDVRRRLTDAVVNSLAES